MAAAETKKKRKQKPKKGRVCRLSPDLMKTIAKNRRSKETFSKCIERLLAEARGKVIVAQVLARRRSVGVD